MKSLLLMIAALTSSQAFAQASLTLQQVIENKDREGGHLLDQGYRGEFTKRFNDIARDSRPDPEPFEYTHAWFPTLKHPFISNDDLPINEIVVGQREPASTGEFRYRLATVAVAKIPPFEVLTKLEKISEYESIFGKSRGFTSAWGWFGEWHSTKGWLGFTHLDNGDIRVVNVFLRTVRTENKGGGWKISTRLIREGVFKPTRKPPVLENAEPVDEPKSR